MSETSHYGQKLVADGVYIVDTSTQGLQVVHRCATFPEGLKEMTLRENEEGPMYWCNGCGYVLEEGLSMAIRLNEVDI